MAEKEQKKPDPAAAEAKGHDDKKAAGKASFLTKTPVLLGGVMVVQAVVLFAGMKFLGFGASKDASAAELVEKNPDDHDGESHAAGDGKSSDDHGGEAKGKDGGEKGKDGAPPARKYGKKDPVEIQVVELRAPNKLSGRTFLYDLSIFIVVRGEHVDKVGRTLKDREALIKDRVRTIIAQSDPEKLGGGSEPGLETLRRQVKYQLDEIVGEGLIEEVLVPRCIPFRTDY